MKNPQAALRAGIPATCSHPWPSWESFIHGGLAKTCGLIAEPPSIVQTSKSHQPFMMHLLCPQH